MKKIAAAFLLLCTMGMTAPVWPEFERWFFDVVAKVCTKLPAPTDSPCGAGGSCTYSSTQSVTLTDSYAGATKYGCYTLDGSAPWYNGATCGNGTHYTGAFNVTTTSTLNYIFCATNYSCSPLETTAYTINTGGTFSLRWTSPANCTASSSTTCVASLTGKAISAGDLLGYQCAADLPIYISTVGNSGTFVPDYAGWGGQVSGRQMSQGYILSAGAESGSDTITMNASSSYTECIIWDYSYTGAPAYDGGNDLEQANASSTSIVAPLFTPSSGSNNDIYMEMEFGAWLSATAVSSPFTLFHPNDSGWAYENNTTTAYGPTFTLPAIGNPGAIQMEFGYSVTAPQKWTWNDFTGSNGATPTTTTLAGTTKGVQNRWQFNGSGTFTYATAASKPLTGSTGRLADGSNVSDSSTTGISFATGTGSANTGFLWGDSGSLIGADVVTAAINLASDLPDNDSTSDDALVISGYTNSDFNNAMLRGDGTHRYISMECGSGQNTSQEYQTVLNTSYHIEEIFNPAVGTVNTTNSTVGACSANCVSWVSGPKFSSKLLYGSAQFYIGAGHTAYTVSAVNSSTLLTLTTAPGTQTGAAYNSAHYLKVYTGWASPSSPGSLVNTQVCYSSGINPAEITFGNGNAGTLTTGHHVYFDSLIISVDGADPL